MTRLVWFRSDLRTRDNPALMHARRDDEVATVAIVFVTTKQWQQHGLGERRINLQKQAIASLKTSLEQLGISLIIAPCETFSDSLSYLKTLLSDLPISEIDFNLEYEVNERKRDIELSKWCADNNITVNKFHDQCMVEPGELKTQNGDPYRVYSPFRRSWLQYLGNHCAAPFGQPSNQDRRTLDHQVRDYWNHHETEIQFSHDDLWCAEEDVAHQQLNDFADTAILKYKDHRDLPSVEGTSRLSFYLALGLLSPRQCVYTAWQRNGCQLSGNEEGIDSWINELTWREFYRHLIVAFPELCKHRAFKKETENVRWRDSEKDFQAWCDGETGFPIVDAAMKQLLDQGWMHNRLRMITAMFLTKQLLIDWRKGEQYFNKMLVDADFSANNGGWQWSASTGADGAPYFRIFNPTTQSERFDKRGEFLTHYLPELTELPEKSRHDPSDKERDQTGYPKAIVDHKFGRERALAAFKQITES